MRRKPRGPWPAAYGSGHGHGHGQGGTDRGGTACCNPVVVEAILALSPGTLGQVEWRAGGCVTDLSGQLPVVVGDLLDQGPELGDEGDGQLEDLKLRHGYLLVGC